MATFTSKGLIKPEDGDNQDVAVLNTNSDRLNAYGMGPVVCTSLTRPTGSNRWDGMLIWETDTKKLMHYNVGTSKWLPVNGISDFFFANIAGPGSVASSTFTSIDISTLSYLNGDVINYNLSTDVLTISSAGLFEVSFAILFGTSTAGNRELRIADASNPGINIVLAANNSGPFPNVNFSYERTRKFVANPGDYKFYLYQDSGATLAIGGGSLYLGMIRGL